MALIHPRIASAGDGRYEFLRKLGSGGSGAVYLARDLETGEQLALKQLHRADDVSIERLKREFRSLANVGHRNVIRLYDLGRAHDEWFLTMEYIDGTDLTGHLERLSSISTTAAISTTMERGGTKLGIDASELAHIVSVFLQLAHGVSALHRAQVLHRDLKPSNVLVEGDRVVVVDFGLALEVGDEAATITLGGAAAGTPAYMAPEQLQGSAWGEPNDWYAFGAMLYEALSGRLPIEGRMSELLRRKLDTDPTPINELVSGLPSALSQLSTALLRRRPEQRPSGDEVVSVLNACLSRARSASSRPKPDATRRHVTRRLRAEPAFVGRADERAELHRAVTDVMAGGFAAVHVRGVSGSGKSALVERFLSELEHADMAGPNGDLMVLRGRCYERETVPFKALDAAMDALVTQLSRMEDLEVSHALPSAAPALAQLFPALNRLSAVQHLLSPNPRRVAALHAREAAESALRDLFSRLGSRRLVVLFIDNLHWGDLDSARIIKSWMQPPGIPGMLLVLSYRSDEVTTSPCLRMLLSDDAPEHVISLGPLGDEDIRALCVQHFRAADQEASVPVELVDHLVREASGSPFLALQLAALASTAAHDGAPETLGQLTIEALVARRTAQLTAPARRLLHVLSAAGRPLPMKLALRLAAAAEKGRAALHELSGFGLIRMRDSDGDRLLAVYHDRLREGVLAGLSRSERAALDRELLVALEAQPNADPAWLHALALGAGERQTALRYGAIAAAHAMAALAFEHAAALYRTCLSLCSEPSDQSLELWEKLALALAHSGHGRQAASAYLEAARQSQGDQALQLERRAASHLLRSGSFEAGEALVNKVLTALQLETPSTQAGLLSAIAWERTRLALRGFNFTPRRVEDLPFWRRFGGELCGTLSIELQPYDPLRAALFQARSLRLALDGGVPELLARALCVAATMAAVMGGSRGGERAEDLLERAAQLARGFSSPVVEGNICSARAVCAMLHGNMREAVTYSDEAERMFRTLNANDEGEYYHRFTVVTARITALSQLGQHEQARKELMAAVAEARASENVSALLLLSPVRTRLEISDDRARQSVARLESERGQLPTHRFGLLHVYYAASVMRVGCATGDHAWALRWLGDDWTRFRSSVFKRGGYFAVIAPALHARLLLNRSVAKGESATDAARQIAGDLRMIERAGAPSAAPAAARTRARLALLAGDRAGARALLEASIRSFESIEGASDEAARDRYAYGVLLGDAHGAELQAAALHTLREFGYANPLRDLASYYPELFVPPS